MPIVLTRPIVLDDLADIWAYIAEDSPSRANTFIDAIDMKFKELAASPHVGRLRTELLDGLSSFPFGRGKHYVLPPYTSTVDPTKWYNKCLRLSTREIPNFTESNSLHHLGW
jgi:plasmid stabilization system protein ParE